MTSSALNGSVPPVAPVFRWAGGKQRQAAALAAFFPDLSAPCEYIEPFFGAGSLFFRVLPSQAILADLNGHLMMAYRHIRDQPLLVKRYLYDHERHDSSAHYYRVREIYNRSKWSAAQAARFVYLNRTCFNGIFRVSRQGTFNVPYGRRNSPNLPSRAHLVTISEVLQRARLRHQSFEKTMASATPPAFVYIDPPYPPLNGTAFFAHYTKGRFTESDQRYLASMVGELDRAGIRFMMSNADIPLIRRLYRRYDITELAVTRWVTCKTIRHRVTELMIRNY